MCGRYALVNDKATLEKYFGRQVWARYRGPSYNVAPTQSVPVVTADGFELMRWGLVPQWAQSLNVGYSMINAVAETLAEKPTYKGPLQHARCVVPASGFYEWLSAEGGKVPYYFRLRHREVFGFAGLFVRRKDSEGQVMKSFTIITTRPNEMVRPIHNRMPAILRQEDEAVWLDSALTDPADVMSLLGPYDADDMMRYQVSNDVGDARNDGPELIKPLE